jgi:hypothetical protein
MMTDEKILLEIQKELSSVAKIILQLAGSFENIGDLIGKLSQTESPADLPTAEPITTPKRAPVRKKVIMKDGVVEKVKRIPALTIVHDLIKNSDQGIDTSGLMKATGYDRIKIQGIIYRLKQQGLIECVRRGIYK